MINESDLIKKAEIRLSCRPAIFTELTSMNVLIEENEHYKLLYNKTYMNTLSGLRVIFSIERHGNGLRWVHVSASHKNRYPTWDELKFVKEIFLGDVWAYQVMPPENHYINISENCFHLWHCANKDIFDEGTDYPVYGANEKSAT